MNMNFDKHIQAILESLSTIPAFDGKREVYGYNSTLSDVRLFYRFNEQDLEHWDNWSRLSDKYQEGECHKRWKSFSKGNSKY